MGGQVDKGGPTTVITFTPQYSITQRLIDI
ncbi:uncharacterized protein G2W53_043708 [Senna tora]|uniref:Uncharacterized protein n=1 Tax=Senna tora TaxID=362788 RepID=A0A834SJ83_9FABA|nr:uncharacterized protein G2W53_043708 [Senna tora]